MAIQGGSLRWTWLAWLGGIVFLSGCASTATDESPPAREAAPVDAHYDTGRVLTRQQLRPGLEAGVFEAFQAARQRCQDQGYRGAREDGPSESRCIDESPDCQAYLIQRQFQCTGGFRPVMDRRDI